ncbi:MAG: hypothetical protein AAFO94_00135, partial [Bacteroidota bacterium]
MKYVKLLLLLMAVVLNDVLIAQESPELNNGEKEHLEKAKEETKNKSSNKPLWLMTKSERRSYDRDQKQKV